MSRPLCGAALAALIGIVLPAFPVLASNPAQHSSQSQRTLALFDEIFDASVQRDPEYQTYLGIKDDYGQWTPIGEAHRAAELAATRADLQRLQAVDTKALDSDTALSFRLLEDQLEAEIEDYRWRYHSYPLNQMFGRQSAIPAFLINQHRIEDVADAEAYISRLEGVAPMVNELLADLRAREERGILPPDFILPHVIADARNVISGAPFDGGEPSILLADFESKIASLEISPAERAKLGRRAEMALLSSVQPAYEAMISYVRSIEDKVSHDAGVWRLPDGDAYYANRLKRVTTTNLSADEIHRIGLAEVERIHAEMDAIREHVGFQGDLKAFMAFMRDDPSFYYPNTDEGREAYLAEARSVLDEMDGKLGELFLTEPKASLTVKRVEPFREKSAGKAFYQQPAPDGTRPGLYYANLYDMAMMPKYQLQALAYHEGLPGHHMQIAIKQELDGLPKFRRFGGVTAYSEGWGLYAELIPAELDLYRDPYADFGRLAMELWRAVRLVVDTGMHAKRWSREQSIEFYVDNTPNARADAVKMVERHAVMPGQATAYKIGMLKILEQRELAKTALGENFDLREFHDVVLRNGAVPLYILEEQVEGYISESRRLASSEDRNAG